MEAFKKWMKDIVCKNDPVKCRYMDCGHCLEMRKETWREALEWFNNKAVELNFSEKGLDICTLQDTLQKELEE